MGSTNDYVLQIVALDLSGVPTNTVLASATVPAASLPTGDSRITGNFDSPATVTAGQSYGLLVNRPGASTAIMDLRTGNDCPGALFGSPNQTDPFTAAPADWDIVFAVFVEPPVSPDNTAPNTQVTAGPKTKTKKRGAEFQFSSNEPGSTFACSLDGGPFQPCSSPKTYDKLKRKKHHFEVTATDPSGNVDPSPATFDWKVKKKRRK
jgi:hypothetical protein